MNTRQFPWDIFKQYVDAKQLSIQYVQCSEKYYLTAVKGGIWISCEILKTDTTQVADFEDNYKGEGNGPI